MIQPLQALMPACLRGVKKYGGGRSLAAYYKISYDVASYPRPP